MSRNGNTPQDKVNRAVEQAQEHIQEFTERTAEDIQHKAAKVGSEVSHTAAEARKTAEHGANNLKEGASDSLLAAAEKLRREAVRTGNSDLIHQAHHLARNMEKAAVYMDSHTFDQISNDASGIVRKNPWETLATAFVIGTIVGVLLSRHHN